MALHTFSDSLKMTLNLKIKGESFKIPGGNIKSCHLNLHSYGFDGRLRFWAPEDQRQDKLIAKFAQPGLIKVELGMTAVHHLPDPPPEPLQVQGLVTTKSVREIAYGEVKKNPVLRRLYEIRFKDPAQVLWQQHFPSDLFVKTTMKAVINDQVAEDMTLEMNWDVLDQEHPMICLGLGGPNNTASFYDFLWAYLAFNDGILRYDYGTHTYKITGEKDSQGEAVSFLPKDIAGIVTRFPETARHNVNLLNGLAEGPATEAITQEQAVTSIHRDILVRMPIQSDVAARKTLETGKLKIRDPELVVDFGQFPLKTFRPGSLFKLKDTVWSQDTLYYNKEYRAFQLWLRADVIEPGSDTDLDTEFTQYRVK